MAPRSEAYRPKASEGRSLQWGSKSCCCTPVFPPLRRTSWCLLAQQAAGAPSPFLFAREARPASPRNQATPLAAREVVHWRPLAQQAADAPSPLLVALQTRPKCPRSQTRPLGARDMTCRRRVLNKGPGPGSRLILAKRGGWASGARLFTCGTSLSALGARPKSPRIQASSL